MDQIRTELGHNQGLTRTKPKTKPGEAEQNYVQTGTDLVLSNDKKQYQIRIKPRLSLD